MQRVHSRVCAAVCAHLTTHVCEHTCTHVCAGACSHRRTHQAGELRLSPAPAPKQLPGWHGGCSGAVMGGTCSLHPATHVYLRVPCMHIHMPGGSMHARTRAKKCWACTYMCHGTSHMQTCARGHQARPGAQPQLHVHTDPHTSAQPAVIRADTQTRVLMHTHVPKRRQPQSARVHVCACTGSTTLLPCLCSNAAITHKATGPALITHLILALCLSFPTRTGPGSCPTWGHRPVTNHLRG